MNTHISYTELTKRSCSDILSEISFLSPSDLIISSSAFVSRNVYKRFSASLTEYGFLDPVIIDERFNVLDGNKRCLTAICDDIGSVPTIIYPNSVTTPSQSIVNDYFTGENYFVKAEIISVLNNIHLFSQERIADLLGTSQSFVANKLRLLDFSDAERSLAEEHSLTERHLRSLLRIKDKTDRYNIMLKVCLSKMNVQACECFVDSHLSDITDHIESTSPVAVLPPKINSLIRSEGYVPHITASSTTGSFSLTIEIKL